MFSAGMYSLLSDVVSLIEDISATFKPSSNSELGMTVPIVFLISESVKHSRSIVLFGGITYFFERIRGYTEGRFFVSLGSRCFDFVDLNC